VIAVVEQPALEPGDLVSLRSGGPALTVAAVEGAKIHCVWFDGHVLEEAELPRACVVRIGGARASA